MAILLRIVGGVGGPSELVRFETRSWASHSEFIDTDDDIAFGAYLDGVDERPIDYAKFKREEHYTFPGIDRAYLWARTQEGKPYDFKALMGIAFNRDWRAMSHWFCSELTTWAAEMGRIILPPSIIEDALWKFSPVLKRAMDTPSVPILNPAMEVFRVTPRDQLLSTVIERVE